MARGFTDIAIKNLKPGADRREIPDPGARGLYVIVEPSGFKSLAVRFRFEGKPKKLSLGNISLSAARKAAAHALHEVKEGRDPTAAKAKAKDERRTIAANTFGRVAEQYLKLVCGMKLPDGGEPTFNAKVRTAARRLADLNRLVLPVLGDRPISEIRRSEIVELLDNIEIERGPVMADRTLALIRRIMNWHATRADNFNSPIVRGMARTKAKERARKRTLDDGEIRTVWNAASEAEGPFPALIKFLLLTGARRDEAARMKWSEIDGGEWILPASRNKVKVELVRPLSAAALAVVEEQRREGSPYVFTTDAKSPISAFSKFKTKFEAATDTSGWTLHDLRRTARSLLSRAGISSDHAERCLGHALPGIRDTYDRYEYYDEKKHAYDALAALIERIANPSKGNVTTLKKKRA
jgi:integrase